MKKRYGIVLNMDNQQIEIETFDGDVIASRQLPSWNTDWITRKEILADPANLEAWQEVWDFCFDRNCN